MEPVKDQDPDEAQDAAVDEEADIFLYSGPIDGARGNGLLSILDQAPARRDARLVLATYGGSADWAYKIIKALRRRHEGGKVTVYVFGMCKSAGTLLALGANEIVMDDRGELGPLDVQVLRGDDFTQQVSGLTVFQTVAELSKQAFAIYESWMLTIKSKSVGSISLKTASDIAMMAVDSIISPIADKIDPDRLGEMGRFIEIANEYGKRMGVSENILRQLTHEYPAHGFVIDREEAISFLGETCRAPNEDERAMARFLDVLLAEGGYANASRIPNTPPIVAFINPPSLPDDERDPRPDGDSPTPPVPDGAPTGGSDPPGEGDDWGTPPDQTTASEEGSGEAPEQPDGPDADPGRGRRGRGGSQRAQ